MLVLLVCALAAHASDAPAPLHVDAAGDDGGDGSRHRPLRTVAAGLARLRAGGRLIIGPGIFREGGLVVRADRAVISGAGAGRTVITGSEAITGWEPVGDGIWRRAGWRTPSQQVFCDGVPLRQIGAGSAWHGKRISDVVALAPLGSGIRDLIPGSFFHDRAAGELSIRLADGGDPTSRLIEASVQPTLLRGEAEGVTLRDLGFRHANGSVDGGFPAMVALGPADWTVEDCAFTWGDFLNLRVDGTGHTVRRCRIESAGDVGIQCGNTDAAHKWRFVPDAPSQRLLIEDCDISRNNYRGFHRDWHAGGMKLIPSVRGVTVRGCRVADNDGAGIWFDHPLGENTITGNTVTGGVTGIFYEIADPGSAKDLAFGAVISRNLVTGTSRQGIYVSASSRVAVERNTVIGCWAGIVVHGMPRGDFGLRDNVVRDNLIGRSTLLDLVLFVGEGAAGNRVDGNFYAGPPRLALVRGTGYAPVVRTLADARRSGVEAAGAVGDPGWLDGDPGFRLRPGAAAAGKGAAD